MDPEPLPISDEELTRQALAARPIGEFDPEHHAEAGVAPFGWGDRGAELLPEWYMPATLRGSSSGDGSGSRRRRAWCVGALVLALVVVNGAGLCVTYGFPEIAW